MERITGNLSLEDECNEKATSRPVALPKSKQPLQSRLGLLVRAAHMRANHQQTHHFNGRNIVNNRLKQSPPTAESPTSGRNTKATFADYSTCLHPWNRVRERIFTDWPKLARRTLGGAILGIVAAAMLVSGAAAAAAPLETLPGLEWYDDLAAAETAARMSQRNLFLYFRDDQTWSLHHGSQPIRHTVYYSSSAQAMATMPLPLPTPSRTLYGRPLVSEAVLCQQFESEGLAADDIQEILRSHVCVALSTRDPLLELPEFAAMGGRAGVAIFALENGCDRTSSALTSAMPFLQGKPFTADHMRTLFALPDGSLTQRSLIYAVRTHPHHPKSTEGVSHPLLQRLALEHAEYQASRRSLGHQNLGRRTGIVKSEVERIASTSEICAVNGFNPTPLEAAIAMVGQWRGSPPHWSAMRRSHTYYGYDMAETSQGHWYAVGFFATMAAEPAAETLK